MEPARARYLWRRLEAVNAVTYFAPECIEAHRAAGFRGFWMGYFGTRAAPLGPVGPGVVEATFYGFHPAMVRRAVPDAWHYVPPADALAARAEGAARALRKVVPDVDRAAWQAVPGLSTVVEAADGGGRPLFSANREVPVPDDPVAALWQCCTTLREHRGDGHVAALTVAGVDGCASLVQASMVDGLPAARLREARGWSEEEWADAVRRLEDRGLASGGRPTPDGRALRATVEASTDRLAARPFGALDDGALDELEAVLNLLAGAVVEAGVLPFPNPMGLPPPR